MCALQKSKRHAKIIIEQIPNLFTVFFCKNKGLAIVFIVGTSRLYGFSELSLI